MDGLKTDLTRWMDITPLDNEIWKDVVGYEGLYQVSNLGRVKSLGRFQEQRNRWGITVRCYRVEHILKPIPSKVGYIRSTLTKDGVHKSYFIHRLVAEAFIPNPDNLPFINHKDEIKSNNCVDNLEWCTAKYNANYGTSIERTTIKNRDSGDIVFQYDKSGKFICSYRNSKDAKRKLSLKSEHINESCKGFIASNGYLWRKEKDGYKYGEDITPPKNRKLTPVIQYSRDGTEVAKYNSVYEASRKTGIPATSIYNADRKNHFAYGYKFKTIKNNC